MPYIAKEAREKFKPILAGLPQMDHCGELNYIISQIVAVYCTQHPVCYQTLNDVAGVLSNANMEAYRRLTASYEDKKITENGDIAYADLIR